MLSLLVTVFALASACSARDASSGGGDSPTYEERVWAERVAKGLADFDCPTPPALAVPAGWYAGPLFDTHLHMPHLPDSPIGTMPGEQDLEGFAESGYAGGNLEPPPPGVIPRAGENITMSEIACTLRYEGTNAAFAYFQVFPNNQGPLVELASRTVDRYPDLLVPFINPPGRVDGQATIEVAGLAEYLDINPGFFRGYGEIPLYAQEGSGAGPFSPDNPVLQEIYPLVERDRMIVYFHGGDNQAVELARILNDHPDTNFIVHGDQAQYDVPPLMDRFPNLYYTVDALYGDQWLLHDGFTAEEFLARTDDFEPLLEIDLADWKEVIEAHPDQFMWGTDRGGAVVWSWDRPVGLRLVDYARAFIGRLDPEVQELFAFGNAQRVAEASGWRSDSR